MYSYGSLKFFKKIPFLFGYLYVEKKNKHKCLTGRGNLPALRGTGTGSGAQFLYAQCGSFGKEENTRSLIALNTH